MIDEMVIWSVGVVMIVKRFEQSSTEKALYKCSHYHYYYYYQVTCHGYLQNHQTYSEK